MGSKADNLPNMRHAYTGLREQIFALCDICAGFNSSAHVISCIFPLTARHFHDVYIFSLCVFVLCSSSVIPFFANSLFHPTFKIFYCCFLHSSKVYVCSFCPHLQYSISLLDRKQGGRQNPQLGTSNKFPFYARQAGNRHKNYPNQTIYTTVIDILLIMPCNSVILLSLFSRSSLSSPFVSSIVYSISDRPSPCQNGVPSIHASFHW